MGTFSLSGSYPGMPHAMTPEEIILKIIEKVEEGDPEVLTRISLVMKNRILTKKEDIREIQAIFEAQVQGK